MKKFLLIVMAVFLLLNTALLIGCGDFNSDDNGDNNSVVEIPQIDNSVDLKDFTPPADDDNLYVEDETYYTSNSISTPWIDRLRLIKTIVTREYIAIFIFTWTTFSKLSIIKTQTI